MDGDVLMISLATGYPKNGSAAAPALPAGRTAAPLNAVRITNAGAAPGYGSRPSHTDQSMFEQNASMYFARSVGR